MATAIKGWEAEKVRCQQLQQMPVPVQTATAESINEARNAVAAASEQLAPKRAFVDAFEGSDGVVVCPTCGETVRNAEARVQAFKAEIATTNEQLKQLSEMIRESEKAHRKYIQEYTQYEATQRHVAERLAEIQESLLHAGDLASVQADAEKAAKLRGMLEELMAGSDQLMQRKKEASAGDVKVAQLAGQLEEVKKQHSLLTAEAANTPLVSDEEATQAQAAINNVTAWTAEHANLDGQISQLQSNRATVIADMDRLKEQIARSDGLRQYRKYCERARTLLHHDCLPMIVTQSYLAALNAKLNEYLRTFNATFTSTIKDDLAVVCNFGSDVERAAGRLSGGQKVALSIAFRFAVYSLFAGSFGFMALDEPTAYLDDDRISCVVELLQQVRQYAHSSGMQLIVPTHEPALMAAVDSVVELS
jgi:exonuclease SbcC